MKASNLRLPEYATIILISSLNRDTLTLIETSVSRTNLETVLVSLISLAPNKRGKSPTAAEKLLWQQ